MPLEYCHCIVILLLFIVSLSKIYNCHIFIVLASDILLFYRLIVLLWCPIGIVLALCMPVIWNLHLFIFYTCTFYASIQLPLVGSIKFILSYLILSYLKLNKEQFTYNTRQSKFMSLGGQLVLQIGRFHGLLHVTNVGGEIQSRDVHHWLMLSSDPIGKWRR